MYLSERHARSRSRTTLRAASRDGMRGVNVTKHAAEPIRGAEDLLATLERSRAERNASAEQAPLRPRGSDVGDHGGGNLDASPAVPPWQ